MAQKLFLLCLFWMCSTAYAIEVTDLYEATLVVDDKTRATRAKASQDALDQVIKKLTGKAGNGDHPLIKKSKRRISDYMLKYEYIEHIEGELKIKVRFEAEKVEKLVRDSGFGLWGNRRPLIAIWLAIEDNLRRDFVTQESYPQLERLIYDTAAEWGVPVVVPLMDLTDRSQVGIAEVWGNFSEPVEAASARYNAERVITGRLFKQPNTSRWQLDWRYTDADMFESVQLVGDKQQLLISMVNEMSSALADEYVIDPNKSYATNSTVITVDGLRTFDKVERAKRQLLTISTVSSVDVVYRNKEQVQFEVEHMSSVSDLQKSLKLEQSFEVYVDPRAFHQVASSSNLRYSWVGQQ
ncbi:hypothetical protein A7985_01250 [Pseudoalteromonas luteoviolacea]|uniref:DUF2066 domain-containing protein n=1 Tax=Pseudoalteromonas luteoviolacea TaxID=43657 RepID=A0A1C0TTG2_9GAMM|nr:DUF2066 domain-containing protein [Pseudoalteromonas luteoviolacea]OCQ22621.1 hypothetical protein A7985_01250 [Pseudoalteromonas luteoviolacea]